jgi:hypothetical protein
LRNSAAKGIPGLNDSRFPSIKYAKAASGRFLSSMQRLLFWHAGRMVQKAPFDGPSAAKVGKSISSGASIRQRICSMPSKPAIAKVLIL